MLTIFLMSTKTFDYPKLCKLSIFVKTDMFAMSVLKFHFVNIYRESFIMSLVAYKHLIAKKA